LLSSEPPALEWRLGPVRLVASLARVLEPDISALIGTEPDWPTCVRFLEGLHAALSASDQDLVMAVWVVRLVVVR